MCVYMCVYGYVCVCVCVCVYVCMRVCVSGGMSMCMLIVFRVVFDFQAWKIDGNNVYNVGCCYYGFVCAFYYILRFAYSLLLVAVFTKLM
jgi:hypothetical protein